MHEPIVAYHALSAVVHAAERLAVLAVSARLRMEADAMTRKQKGRPKAPS